jgi:gliding motility-associated-like protein
MKKLFYSTILFFQIHFTFSQVVINEILVNPVGGSTDPAFQSMYNSVATYGSEFIEIYNTSNCNSVDISCWTIGGMDGGSNGGAFSFPAGTIIPPLGFITIGGPNTANITFNLNLAANSGRLWRSNASRWHIPNGDGWVALYNASGVTVDAVYWTFASNDPTKLNNDATFTSGVLQRIATCGGGGLATASSIPGIEYISQATVAGQSYERSTDGGSTWALASATPNSCNGNCASSAFSLNATVVQPTCGNDNGSISFAPSPSGTYFYSWPFPSSSTVNSVSNLAPGSYNIIVNSTNGCPIDTTILLTDIPCGNVCDPNGNLVIYSNYDGGILTINVDQNIPNIKVGICTYEPIQVNFTGPFVGNITQVIYAGMNSNQNNNNCGQGNFTTSVTGVPTSIVTISPPLNPPQVGYTPAHGNGSGPWGGGMLGVSGLCDTTTNGGGGNTPDEVVYYFQTATGGTLLYHQTQYACWTNQTLNVSAGGNCCILPPGSNPCTPPTMTSPNSASICSGATVNIPLTSNPTGATFSWIASANNNVDGESIIEQTNNVINNTLTNTTTSLQTIVYTLTPTANGCAGTPQTVNVTVNPYPTTPTITTTAASCSAAGTATISNYVGTQTYTFSPSGPSAEAGGIISSMTTGTSYTVTASNGSCSSTASASFSSSAQLIVPTTPTITTTSATCSAAGTATISNYIGTQTYAFSPLGPSVGAGGVINSMMPGTSYTVTISNGTCTSLASTSFSNSAQLSVPTTPTITTTSATCSAAGTATISNYVENHTYTFSPAGPSVGAGGVISSMTPGTSYTVTASNGSCSSTVSSLFNIAESNSFNVVENINPATCDAFDGTISLSTLGGIAPFSYNWSGGVSTTNILSNIAAGNYSVIITDQNGCSVAENYLVPQINTFDFDVFPAFYSITSGETVQFNANGAISYSWSPSSSLNCNDCPNPIAKPTENTIYMIIGENSNGCIDTVYASVSVKGDNFLYVPNTFTPDGDEFNNVFIPCLSDSFDPQSYTLLIFNRWGELIFETKDLNEGWNGTYNGKLQQKGVYTWEILLKTKDLDDIKEFHGHVLLLR